MKILIPALAAIFALALTVSAQSIPFSHAEISDGEKLPLAIVGLASNVLEKYERPANSENYLNDLLRLQILSGKYGEAIKTIKSQRNASSNNAGNLANLQLELYAEARTRGGDRQETFEAAFGEVLSSPRLLPQLERKCFS